MKTCTQYLDAVKIRYQFTSDYQLARFLGEPPNKISNYRTQGKTFGSLVAVKIAKALDLDPMEVIAAANYQRTKRPEEKTFWADVFNQLRRTAAALSICFLGVQMAGIPSNAEAAGLSGPGAQFNQEYRLCEVRRRRRASLAARALSALRRLIGRLASVGAHAGAQAATCADVGL